MPKKNDSQSAESTVITITLPESGDFPRTGQILVQRGTLGTFGQFQYEDLAGIAQAIQDGAVQLLQVEENPPPADVKAPPVKGNAEMLAGKQEQAATPEPDGQGEAEQEAEPEATEEIAPEAVEE